VYLGTYGIDGAEVIALAMDRCCGRGGHGSHWSTSQPPQRQAGAAAGCHAESSEGTYQDSETILTVLCGMRSASRAAG
jgi:hypothetical protein